MILRATANSAGKLSLLLWATLIPTALTTCGSADPLRVVEVFRITEGGSVFLVSDIDNGRIVWMDTRRGVEKTSDPKEVYLYQMSDDSETHLGFAHNTVPRPQRRTDGPALGLVISGDVVVWPDARSQNWGIHGYDIAKKQEISLRSSLGNAYTASVNGTMVVWSYYVGEDLYSGVGDYDIHGYDLSTNSEVALCEHSGERSFPVVSGGMVIWADGRRTERGTDIYGCDLASREETVLVEGPGTRNGLRSSEYMVVWQQHGAEAIFDIDIYGYNLRTESIVPIAVHEKHQQSPDVDGDIVVWEDWRAASDQGHQSDIYAYDLLTGTEIIVRACSEVEHNPHVSGDTVIWISDRDLYGARLSRSKETGSIVPCNAANRGVPFRYQRRSRPACTCCPCLGPRIRYSERRAA